MVEWAHEFGATIHLPAADREWVMRPDPSINFWSGSVEPVPGIRVIQTGGHFDGAAVLHWNGALLTGDIVYVLPGRDARVSFCATIHASAASRQRLSMACWRPSTASITTAYMAPGGGKRHRYEREGRCRDSAPSTGHGCRAIGRQPPATTLGRRDTSGQDRRSLDCTFRLTISRSPTAHNKASNYL
jgi:glyoxylase-like metal-dependent hydrolase (beta-lactamase superfamily II)